MKEDLDWNSYINGINCPKTEPLIKKIKPYLVLFICLLPNLFTDKSKKNVYAYNVTFKILK